ncbi:CHRD domain-containing protein [Xenococcus sp. PCC 7305]|uniref:spondin domain-containing protein n=1 Tax=Xenococcus sp. PCC 7305 TaxID=102125 RepID=UPI0002AB9C70|nr:spondin domain-containing protein [Xenococcus sp. PCC 7305]ELS03836.1 CHRD domain-containing protein [Xenococcus sp. PCC 7305]
MSDVQVTVKIENLAPDHGIYLTPFWVGFHNGNFDTFDFNRPATTGVERLAEDGDTSQLSARFIQSGVGSLDSTILGGDDGVIAPGETVEVTFTLDNEDAKSRYFNFLSMVIPSNDAFIGNHNHRDFPIFDEEGNFLDLKLTINGDQVADAGTEVNDELEANTAFFSQATPNTGTTEDGLVRLHAGFIEGGRILSEDGSSPNAPASFTGADFTADGYQIAEITVTSSDAPRLPISLSSLVDDEQIVGAGVSDGTGSANLVLNDAGDALDYQLTLTDLDFGANGLIPGGAQTPDDPNDDVTRIHIRNAARGANGEIAFSIFDTVTPSLGNEVGVPGNQDEDLVITPNSDGSVTLTGVWESTDSSRVPLSEYVTDIRSTGEDEDVDLYWNVYTEEFPGGSTRGQLVVDNDGSILTEDDFARPIYRFQNLNARGTYLYVATQERASVINNFPNFEEEGVAFHVSLEPREDFIPLYRFQSLLVPGTYIYVGDEERADILANFSESFGEEGLAFYVYGAGAEQGLPFSRFHNNNFPGTYLYAAGEEANNIRTNFLNFDDEGIAFEAL